jgi:hypothetical protein
MRRETSRVSFLMCPFCVRALLPSGATPSNGAFERKRPTAVGADTGVCCCATRRSRQRARPVFDRPVGDLRCGVPRR